MPLTGDEYRQYDREQILAFLESELRAEYGVDVDLTDGSTFSTFASAVSGVDAEYIEPALAEVHDAAFLDSAEGANLDNVVSILGIDRRGAIHATGTVRFGHGSVADQDYPIDNGTTVQTGGEEPVEFETSDRRVISWFDDFESGSLRGVYAGQRSSFSVVDGSASADPNPFEGGHCLKGPQTNGDLIYTSGGSTSIGDTSVFRTYLEAGAIVGNCFGVIDADNYYRVKVDSATGEIAIEKVTSSGGTNTLVTDSATVPEDEWVDVEVVWSPEERGTITARLYDGSDSLVEESIVTGVGDDITEGGFGFESLDGSADKYWDHSGQTEVLTNVRASEGGPDGNVAAGTITVIPNPVSGVQTLTNPYPTGDDEHYLTSLHTFTNGRPRETDEELRDRAAVSEGTNGVATVPALIAELTSLPEAESINVFENKENTDNTGSGGLPPKSFEVVYYGTDDDEVVANTIWNVKGFTARDYGGAHGTEVTYDVETTNGQVFTVRWSVPAEVSIDMTLDVVVNDQFIGKDSLRDQVVNYVGGTLSDGTRELGTGTNEDIYVDQIEDVVTGPDDTGVIGISNYTFTPSVTTDSNGLEIVDVGANEVGQTNAQDGSITINVTRV